jgi:hypothetical protein
MFGFKQFNLFITEMAAKREGATLSSDDQGKLYEIELAKAINGHPEVNRGGKLPRHWRAKSENKEHSGTPGEVYNRLRKKAGAGSKETKLIKKQATENAANIVDSLNKSGHIGKTETNGVKHPSTRITNVFWTSNRDTAKSAGDHEQTSGIRDPKSKGDVMVTIAPRHPDGHHGDHHDHYVTGHAAGVTALVAARRAQAEGKEFKPPTNPHPKGSRQHKVWAEGFSHGQMATHVNISAKYAANPINYENAGHASMENKTGSKGLAAKLEEEQNSSDEAISKKFGYTGKSHAERHEKFKVDRDIYEAEKKAHKEKVGSYVGFKPKSAAAKRAHEAYGMANASLRRGIGHVANSMRKMDDTGIKNFIASAVVPDTVHETIVAHSHPVNGRNTVHSSAAYRSHLDEYHKLEIGKGDGDEEGGTSMHVYGTHKKTGERKPIFSLGYKTNSGTMGARQFGVRLPQFK